MTNDDRKGDLTNKAPEKVDSEKIRLLDLGIREKRKLIASSNTIGLNTRSVSKNKIGIHLNDPFHTPEVSRIQNPNDRSNEDVMQCRKDSRNNKVMTMDEDKTKEKNGSPKKFNKEEIW